MTTTKEMRSARNWFFYDLVIAGLNIYWGFQANHGFSWFAGGLLLGLALFQALVWIEARNEAERVHLVKQSIAAYTKGDAA